MVEELVQPRDIARFGVPHRESLDLVESFDMRRIAVRCRVHVGQIVMPRCYDEVTAAAITQRLAKMLPGTDTMSTW